MQFSPTWGLYLRKVRIFPGQFWKINTQSITFSKYVLSHKFPTDTQNAILTSKLEEFYRDSQNISVKGREPSSEHFPKNAKKFSCSRWRLFWQTWRTVSTKKKEFFWSNFENFEIISFFWRKSNFLTKKFVCLRRMQFWQVWRKVYARNLKTLARFSKSIIHKIVRRQKKYTSPKKSSGCGESKIWKRA